MKSGLDRRIEHINRNSNIPIDEIHKAVTFLFDNTYFQFNEKFFKQLFGSPMGGNVPNQFADIVLEDLEVECIKKLSFIPVFFIRYVDDILTLIPSNKITEILDIFNSYHPRLKFTHEVEKEQKIPFLDLSHHKRK